MMLGTVLCKITFIVIMKRLLKRNTRMVMTPIINTVVAMLERAMVMFILGLTYVSNEHGTHSDSEDNTILIIMQCSRMMRPIFTLLIFIMMPS